MENEAMAGILSWLPILFMLVVFYFFLYRPQKKAQQERSEMLSSLKVGVEIVTIGGIYGTITELADDFVKIQVADKVEIKISRSAIGSLTPKEKNE